MVDRYTKSVLTIIAAALVVIAVRGLDVAAPALAQQQGISPRNGTMPVTIVGIDRNGCPGFDPCPWHPVVTVSKQ